MIRRVLLTAAVFAAIGAGQTGHAEDVVAEGQILVASSTWTNVRSITVLTWTNGVDGFIFPVAHLRGECLTTRTRDRIGLGYNLTFNFHDASRTWLGGCNTAAADERCYVPAGAATGEVTAARAVLVDVTVVRVHDPIPGECTFPVKR